MRHAKAVKGSYSNDYERDLEERGKRDAAFVAAALHKSNIKPDLIVASPSNRTKKTALIVARELNLDIQQIEFETSIYEAEIEDLMHVIRSFNDKHKTILLIGHNPSMTGIIGYLSNTFLDHLPTSGIVVVDLQESTWKQTQSRKGKVVWSLSPKGVTLI
jgi:phosphohistidine phosphatase